MKTEIEDVLNRYAANDLLNLKAADVREMIADEIEYQLSCKYIIEKKPDYSGINQQEPGMDY